MDLLGALSTTHLLLAGVALCAGFIDAVAGGGGMLTVPSLMLAVPDPRVVLGTNKGQSVWGTLAATIAFARAGKLDRARAPVTFATAALGSALGASLATRLRPELLRPVVLVLLLCAAAFVFARSLRRAPASPPPADAVDDVATAPSDAVTNASPSAGDASPSAGDATPSAAPTPLRGKAWARRSPRLASGAIGFALGAYDGFFGPGTGTFLIVAFSWAFGEPLDSATANAKVANLASNLAALVTFVLAGRVDLRFAAPMAVAQLVGGALGARATLRGGERLVRVSVLLVTAALSARLAWQLLG